MCNLFTTTNFLNDIFGNNKDVLARIKVSLKCLAYSRAATNLMVHINLTARFSGSKCIGLTRHLNQRQWVATDS